MLSIPIAHAEVDMTAFGNFLNPIIDAVVYPLIALLFGIAVLVFVWGVLQFVLGGNEETAREKGKMTMKYGTIGFFIMIAAWGIVYIVSNTVKQVQSQPVISAPK